MLPNQVILIILNVIVQMLSLGFEVFRKSKNDQKFSEISFLKIRYGYILRYPVFPLEGVPASQTHIF